MDIKKNDILTVEITDTGTEGEGIGKLVLPAPDAADTEEKAGGKAAGFTLFVKDAVIGDTVQVKVMKAKKNYAYAKLEKVIVPSPFRVQPPCAFHRQCGGCQLQSLSYEKQLEFKQNKIRNNLVRIGGFDPEKIDACMEPIIGMEDPWHYRNKAQFPFGYDKEGNVVTGFYAGRSHTIIPNTDCALGVEENQEILEIILRFMKKYGVSAYEEVSGKGLLRHVLIRKGFASGQLMVCLIINGKKLPEEQRLADELWKIPGMTSVSVNVNMERTNVIMGKKVRVLKGEEKIEDSIGDVVFRISPLSFYQVNPVQTRKLYGQALEYAGLTGEETVWDLYCGIGTISLFLAQKAKKVYGVEIVPEAIADAKENATRNGITNAEFFVGKAEEVLPRKYEEDGVYADVIVVDPPRKGCDEKCLETMVRMRPGRIVYVSCDSATLGRDLKYLGENGYEVVRVRGVDQFPGTTHVETVVLMSKVQK
ncbi:23S rRNA m(5)U-1939 methyltransferase [Lachnospiraceae bacterium NLAE-zl-G231]|nr:23S rRNA m(5)U-1939 methyltransferase [Lachnospiraceae bacterium NLAE-zl-G231]